MTGAQSCQPDSEHTPTPWVYRPHRHDDWGWIRGQPSDGEEIAPLVACARSGNYPNESVLDEHRKNGTDPFGANAAFIVEAVNSHAALKSRVEELTKALQDIQAKTNGDRPTVHAGNAFHYWQQLNKTVIDIRERCGVALSLEQGGGAI